jgi:hypothetical protein
MPSETSNSVAGFNHRETWINFKSTSIACEKASSAYLCFNGGCKSAARDPIAQAVIFFPPRKAGLRIYLSSNGA